MGSVPLAALAGSTTGSVLGSVTDASAAGAADGARFLHSYGALSSAMASLARLHASANFLPHHVWATGSQLVALNWQTMGAYRRGS